MGLLIAIQKMYEMNYVGKYPRGLKEDGNVASAGFTLGATGGVCIEMSKHADFNIEVAPRTVNFNGSFLVPATMGVRFKL